MIARGTIRGEAGKKSLEQADEARLVAGSRRGEEGFEQPISLYCIDRVVPLFGEVPARPVPRVDVAELERFGDCSERLAERLAQYAYGAFDYGAFDGGQAFHQEQCAPVPHLRPVGALPADPHILNGRKGQGGGQRARQPKHPSRETRRRW
ncbi:hypothetical protein [Streptomyces sp. NBC_00005]|uniref:hypothetical protein n=1 Tax=Streptomyces sp. NBC_00005 TaxID=2903609 RepID=UPI00324F82DA